jgi:hypothetical protein
MRQQEKTDAWRKKNLPLKVQSSESSWQEESVCREKAKRQGERSASPCASFGRSQCMQEKEASD